MLVGKKWHIFVAKGSVGHVARRCRRNYLEVGGGNIAKMLIVMS